MNFPPQPELSSAVISAVREKGHLSGQDMEAIARSLRIPTSRVYGFCSQFPEFTRPAGRPVLRICSGPACASAELDADMERAMAELESRADVLRVPGLTYPHDSPALTVRLPGEEERMVQDYRAVQLEELTRNLDRKDLSAYPFPEMGPVSEAVGLDGEEMSPWLASLVGEESFPALNAETVQAAVSDPAPIYELLEGECVFPSPLAQSGPPAILVCDTVGPSTEGSVDLMVSLACPRVVVAGSLLAAAALGARKVLFFVPWYLGELESELRRAAEEEAAAADLEWEVLPGPTYIPCYREVGVAAFIQGMMLWRAASICGRDGPLRLNPPTLVCGASTLWKAPWVIGQGSGGKGWKERLTLIALGPEGLVRWVELPPALSIPELESRLGGGMPHGIRARAFYLEGRENRLYPKSAEKVEIPYGTRRLVVLGESVCMAGWARRMLSAAEEECCGGCTPGRTAPSAAAAVLESVTEGGEEERMREMAIMLERAELLALCPQLLRTFPVLRECMGLFPEDFIGLLRGKEGREGMVSGSVNASGMGGRR